jgi:cytolysin (calcineurin-like family phosphatase)
VTASPATFALRPVDSATQVISAALADRLEADALDLAHAMADAVFAEVPVYRGLRNADLQRTVLKHSVDHVHAVVYETFNAM